MSARPLVAGRHARSWLHAGATAACVAVFSSLLCGTAAAQLISIKTVPVAEGDQFAFLPSANLGMAGVSIALNDTLLDPFSNPAKAARLRGTHFFGSPSFYSVSSNAGSGRTLPLGGFTRRGSSYAGFALALQEVSGPRRSEFGNPTPPVISVDDRVFTSVAEFPTTPRTRTNQYAVAMLGRTIPERGMSLAASVFWSGLSAVDGVDLLYAGSQNIKQFGQSLDFRVGVLKEWTGDQSLEAVVVHNRFAMTHDVTYVDFFWDPTLRQALPRPRMEHNPDRTNTWGLHLQYQRPLADSGRRIGAILTANRMSHPKIPNYEIMAIPRDPGYSSAFNIGVGLSESEGPLTFGIDAIIEPIWSHTWADAEAAVPTSGGGIIPYGGKTIENRFRFANGVLRAGLSREFKLDAPESSARMQFGVQLRSISYHLDQYSHVLAAGREQTEGWTEWTYAWGASVRLPDLEIHYRLRMTSGTGRPGVASNGGFLGGPTLADSAGGRNFLVAPSGALTLDPVHVTTHQISVSLPLR
ncbi:MAG: hypothetical protein M3282_02620 [Gemmatimonadota bacterium]|nr:hypothetical protein [Gemmatimonadota bacterium]